MRVRRLSCLGDRLLAASDGLLRPLPRACVRLRALPAHRKAAPVADTAVAADFGQALDCLPALTPKLTLDFEIGVDVVPELRDLLVGQVANLLVRIELQGRDDLARGRGSDAVDVREPDLEPLLGRKVDSGDACHGCLSPAFACD